MRIKDKEYVTVNERVGEFRSNKDYNGWSIQTEILGHSGGMMIMKATIRDTNDRIISQGTAYETNESQGSNMINLTSYIENCETSAVGRALGFLGIGSSGSIASADEVQNAIRKQTNSNPSEDTKTTGKTQRRTFSGGPGQGNEPEVEDDRPAIGTTYIDDQNIEWVVKRQKAADIRFWATTDGSSQTSHIG